MTVLEPSPFGDHANLSRGSKIFLSGKPKAEPRVGSGMYKGQGQLGDLNAPSNNFTQRLSLSSTSFPRLKFPADSFYAAAANQAVTPCGLLRNRKDPAVIQWGLQLQTAWPEGFVVDTGYMGYHGYHQFPGWYDDR